MNCREISEGTVTVKLQRLRQSWDRTGMWRKQFWSVSRLLPLHSTLSSTQPLCLGCSLSQRAPLDPRREKGSHFTMMHPVQTPGSGLVTNVCSMKWFDLIAQGGCVCSLWNAHLHIVFKLNGWSLTNGHPNITCTDTWTTPQHSCNTCTFLNSPLREM